MSRWFNEEITEQTRWWLQRAAALDVQETLEEFEVCAKAGTQFRSWRLNLRPDDPDAGSPADQGGEVTE